MITSNIKSVSAAKAIAAWLDNEACSLISKVAESLLDTTI